MVVMRLVRLKQGRGVVMLGGTWCTCKRIVCLETELKHGERGEEEPEMLGRSGLRPVISGLVEFFLMD